MGLRDDVQIALADAMNTDLSDVVTTFRLVVTTNGAYDPITGTFEQTVVETPGRGIFDSFGADELRDSQIKSTDAKLIVNGPDIGAIPAVDDRIVADDSGDEYFIIRAKPIMGETPTIVWELQLRKVED